MEAVGQPSDEPELHLLTEWGSTGDRKRERKAAVFSVLGHALAVVLLMAIPADWSEPEKPREAPRVTPLVAPPVELTQRAPNKGKLSKEFDVVESQERPNIQIPQGAPSTKRPRAFRPALPQPPPVKAASPLPEAPKVDAPKLEVPQIAQATPQIQPVEQPKLALENVAPPPPPLAPGQSKIAIPNVSVADAVRQAVRATPSGGLMVGDLDMAGPGGSGTAVNLPPSPGMQGSNLELLSDPQGVDFRPYLMQVLAAVRRNWLAVLPESAKLGRRGRVSLQFAIARVGSVAKLVIVNYSGTDALDRAAVAGISASDPFPPLPSEYKGERVVLQFNFAYNMPRR
jgi:TonB family protein